ncbi:YfhO family protein [Agrilactobacillus fermenti]|uniref:YfhO family protein n=1 Tax=Agrilactobacillus fermenti TaxID=2586909 RepID=UPI0022A93496|nr:YfhO family protein [Agrilactobacillus fermenti]
MHSYLKRHYIYIFSFLIPAFSLLFYFMYRGAYPFGKSSLLTVDLGQQYIDFFAYFKQNILTHPTNLIYSFSKALGGDMLGVSAYYLISPLNIILLLFPQQLLPVAIYLISILKFGFAGLTAAIFFKRSKLQLGPLTIAYAVSFALMSYLIVNHFNLMWLDAVIVLPLVCLYVPQFFKQKYSIAFSIWLAIAILLNYYIGYMIVIFVTLYFIFQAALYFRNWSRLFRQTWHFFLSALAAVLTSSVLLLPTLFALSESKGQYTIQHIKWQIEYAPYKLMLKLIMGSFNFDQMSTGQANIFVGSLAIFGFLFFFTLRQIPLRAKITAAFITIFLIVSLFFEPFDLFWHGFQFPVWYPYRFSFVVSFWLLILSAYSFHFIETVNRLQIALALVFTGILGALAFWQIKNVNFIEKDQIFITVLLMLLMLVLLTLKTNRAVGISTIITVVTTIELAGNLIFSLNNITYLNESDFTDYTSQLVSGAQAVKQKANATFYRIGKTYERTKNDPMQANYNGGSQFNSMMEPALTHFYGRMGQDKGDGFVTYNNGTIFTDALLDMRYFMQQRTENTLPKNELTPNTVFKNVASRPDLSEYNTIDVLPLQTIHYNPMTLPIAFVANRQILRAKQYVDFPLAQQESWFHAINPNFNQPLFEPNNYQIKRHNLRLKKKSVGQDYVKINPKKTAMLELTFVPRTDDPYYLTWGSSLNNKLVSLTINNQNLQLEDSYDNPLVYGVADQQQGQTITIKIILKKNDLWLDNISINRFNMALFKNWINQTQATALKRVQTTPTSISGSINVKTNQQLMMTTIPYSKGWHLTVDGKAHKITHIQQTFLGAELDPGQHKIKFSYRPPLLMLGVGLSFLGILLIIIFELVNRKSD